MAATNWQLKTPINAIIFDCDGTLSTLEGIDELARMNGVGEIIEALTAEAMGKSGLSADLYQKRLSLVKPTQQQVLDLGQQYFTHKVPDIDKVIQLLKRLDKHVYIVSSGLYASVVAFGKALHIPKENIFAVDINFDAQGNYLDFDHDSPLINNDGKRKIVSQIKQKFPEVVHVGDGLNDYSVYDLVTRFIGYGGVFYRKNIESFCDFYITTLSMSALLPLVLTEDECKKLLPEEVTLYAKSNR